MSSVRIPIFLMLGFALARGIAVGQKTDEWELTLFISTALALLIILDVLDYLLYDKIPRRRKR